ncbi:HlyD family secretion protein [Saccharicrinis aurantiacus]|uniref:HlyD family secretion protein n=1 Tax=Saccharicrinis aurantiacus TaxID=1849719 RepID=UPI00094FFC7B|nr:HlyD family secretion protein [Saccharicrinis aurantiacus]
MNKNNSQESNNDQQPDEITSSEKKGNPIVLFTRITLIIAILFFIWYVLSDRKTPYTQQAYITELIIPITPRVTGYVTEVNVQLNSSVKTGDKLFEIDKQPFDLALKKAEANLDNASQQIGAQGATVKAAASSVGVAKAQLDRAQRNYDRTQRLIQKNPGAVSQADIDRVETSLSQSVEKLANAEANLTKAKEQLGAEGNNNAQLRLAIAEVEKAELDLSFTNIFASNDGFIESFNIDIGYYAQAGQAMTTLVSKQDVWIQADFTENNISLMKIGNPVSFALDVAPGRRFEGKVRGIGNGVDTGNSVNRGGLPTISSSSSWLRDPQRFPVTISFTDEEAALICRSGGQADVVVFTSDSGFFNTLAKFRLWINSWLSYVR